MWQPLHKLDNVWLIYMWVFSGFVQFILSTLNSCLFFNIIEADKKLKHCLLKSSKPFYLIYSLIQKIIASARDLPFAGVDPDQVLSEPSKIVHLYLGIDVVSGLYLLLPRHCPTRIHQECTAVQTLSARCHQICDQEVLLKSVCTLFGISDQNNALFFQVQGSRPFWSLTDCSCRHEVSCQEQLTKLPNWVLLLFFIIKPNRIQVYVGEAT